MTDITIYTSANNGEEILVLPLPPKNLPDIVQEWGHEEFETNDYVLTLIGGRKRRSLSLELLLPVYKSYRAANRNADPNGMAYIEFWEKWSKKKVPMRLIITEGAAELLNMAYTIKSLKWHYDRKKDIVANLDIEEYMFTFEGKSIPSAVEYRWEEVFALYNGLSYPLQGANIGGHYIVQVRKLLKALGYEVGWKADTKQITYAKNGVENTLASSFEIYGGTAYGYVYEICGELNLKTEWDGNTKTITITEV